MSTGLACTLLIYLWVSDEMGVDKFHEKDSQIFQVLSKFKNPGNIKVGNSTPYPLAKALAEEMPEVEYAVPVRTWTVEQGIVSVGDKLIRASEQYVGKDYFDVFSYQLIHGDKNRVLTDKYAVLISDELARKLFNTTENSIGKSIEWNKEALSGTYLVSGIFKKPPLNSTTQFDLVFSFELYTEKKPQVNEWSNGGVATYVILRKGVDLSQFNEKIGAFLEKKNGNPDWSLFARLYSDQYLYGNYENGEQSGGRIEYVRLFSMIAIFILFIACINFMNLSTAKTSGRIKEIGVKKAIGADRKALIFQFLGESLVMTSLSLLVAIVFVIIFLPQFNVITGKELSLAFDIRLVFFTLGVTLITGIIAGSYPALYLSGFNPIMVLKGKLNSPTGEGWARKGLVVFQFAISVVLIVAVTVVYKQIEFIQTKNLGYDKENIILFGKEGRLNENLETFLHEVKNIPGVVNASIMMGDMTSLGNITSDLDWEGKSPDKVVAFGEVGVGYDLIETLGLEIREGRGFSRKFGSDSSKILFNEAAIAAMGLTNPIGKTIRLWDQEKEIIGVTGDFHSESFYEPLKPCFVVLSPYVNTIAVKIKGGIERETIERIQKFYRSFNTDTPFDFKFMDEGYQSLYVAENRIATLSQYFATIAILVSCLGLFGLAAFTAERRIKEIGIRKVLGASEWRIIKLLSNDFARMVLTAIVIALPVGYYLAKNWLDNFAYRIDLEWWYFAGAGGLTMLIALLTVSSQAIKAAMTNPVKSLRTE
ncbi:MAG: ABC transporter permease [Chitinophagaceae bacterium]|nr:ABC transporter permease [Chitinophagaceae bacterium]MCW5926669.1 ABC transporter permease [Chitinophagaceae bacterium]